MTRVGFRIRFRRTPHRAWYIGVTPPPPSRVRLDRGGLPSETLKSGSLERGQPAGSAKETILRVSSRSIPN